MRRPKGLASKAPLGLPSLRSLEAHWKHHKFFFRHCKMDRLHPGKGLGELPSCRDQALEGRCWKRPSLLSQCVSPVSSSRGVDRWVLQRLPRVSTISSRYISMFGLCGLELPLLFVRTYPREYRLRPERHHLASPSCKCVTSTQTCTCLDSET